MSSRKSQPRIDPGLQRGVIAQRGDRTLVETKLPSAFPEGTHHERGKAAPENVIPFARPRAIASLPTMFSTPIAGRKSPRSTPAPKPVREKVTAAAITPPSEPTGPAVSPPPPAPVITIVPATTPGVGPMALPPRIVAAPYAPQPPAPIARPLQVPVAIASEPLPGATSSFTVPTTIFPRGAVPLPPEPPLHLAAEPAGKWAAFERIGLRAPKVDVDLKRLSKHVVTGYRLLGFVILTIIVVVLIGYIATTAFFYLSDSWIVPMAVSQSDEKVVALQAQLAERQNNRDKIAADLDDANRAITVQQAFQTEFGRAIKSDLDGRKAALARMHELAQAAAVTRTHIRAQNSAYAAASQNQMATEWKAGLIDRQAMLAGKFQLAQITSSNLTLAERQAEYETRAADLESQTRSLDALLANAKDEGALSYDVLKIKQDYEASRLETQKAIEARDTLKAAFDREDKLIKSLQATSYLRALGDHAQVAFVPYGNLHKVDKGDGLYGCRLGMIVCHKVGTVLEILPGEVQFKHPHRDAMLRGQMVELQLEDGEAATDDVLFVGGRPLFI